MTAFIGTNNVVLGEQLIHWYAKTLQGKLPRYSSLPVLRAPLLPRPG